MSDIQISAVAFQEGDVWVVQGIEYDIVAHASEIDRLPAAFMRAIVENAYITEHLGRRPLEGIKPAPAHFRALFDNARTELRAILPLEDHGSAHLSPPEMSIRLAH